MALWITLFDSRGAGSGFGLAWAASGARRRDVDSRAERGGGSGAAGGRAGARGLYARSLALNASPPPPPRLRLLRETVGNWRLREHGSSAGTARPAAAPRAPHTASACLAGSCVPDVVAPRVGGCVAEWFGRPAGRGGCLAGSRVAVAVAVAGSVVVRAVRAWAWLGQAGWSGQWNGRVAGGRVISVQRTAHCSWA